MMNNEQVNIINCSTFEELLTDYLDKTLASAAHKAVAEHALACPLCHSLLNDVKGSIEVCHQMSVPAKPLTRLEARVLAMTMPETAMPCEEFEGYLTDYLDGFLPAQVFHRWERHAALCTTCEDLPGMVVRSIAACYTYKTDELEVPAGLNQRIINLTSALGKPQVAKASWSEKAVEWIKGIRLPAPVPQIASVATMMLFAFMVFSQTVSADGSLAGVYAQGVQLAEQTFQQSSEVLKPVTANKTPVNEEK